MCPMSAVRPLLTFDLDGVLCRPLLGINPGRNINKPRRSEGHATPLTATERFRFAGRRAMPGAREGFLWLAQTYDCQVLSARTEMTRSTTESWFRRWFGTLPPIHLRDGTAETPAAFKLRKAQELGALAHFEDDPHTAEWLAEVLPAVILVDWWRNRWLKAPRVHRVHWIAEAGAILRQVTSAGAGAPDTTPAQSVPAAG